MFPALSSANNHVIAAFLDDEESSIFNTLRQVTFSSLGNFERTPSIGSLLWERLNRRAYILVIFNCSNLSRLNMRKLLYFFCCRELSSKARSPFFLSPSIFFILKFLHFSFFGLVNHCLNQNLAFIYFLFLILNVQIYFKHFSGWWVLW